MGLNRWISQARIRQAYQDKPSISPWIALQEYSHQGGFLLHDGASLGVAFRLQPLVSDVRSPDTLQAFCTQLQGLLCHAIPRLKKDPWILQCYVEDEPSLKHIHQQFYDRIPKNHPCPDFVKQHCQWLERHHTWLVQEKGAFYDKQVTGTPFRGKTRTIRCCLYRKRSTPLNAHKKQQAWSELQQASHCFQAHCRSIGLRIEPMDGKAMYDWLVAWLNPAPSVTEGKRESLLKTTPYPGDKAMPFGWDYSEKLFFSRPKSEGSDWIFDGWHHRVLTANGITREPVIGQLTGEIQQGEYQAALLDHLPFGTRIGLTLVFCDQEHVSAHLDKQAKSATGAAIHAQQSEQQIRLARERIAKGDHLLPCVMAVYLRGENPQTLAQAEHHTIALLTANGFHVFDSQHALHPLDAYWRHFPMNYDHTFDQRYTYQARHLFSTQLAKLLPVYGRSTGTGHPGFLFFNRGGEAFTYDPFQDKSKNSHLLLLGETGTGKSNLCQYLLAQLFVLYHPRCFVLEAGGSFDLWADCLAEHGYTVNRVRIHVDKPVAMNPFAASQRLLAQMEGDKPRSDGRDLLNEMLTSALIMVTGGDSREETRLMRSDHSLLLEAILSAAKTAKATGKDQFIASDLMEALQTIARQLDLPTQSVKSQRATQLADQLNFFCADPIASAFFNQPSTPWPLVDLTVVDFGLFAGENYKAHLAIAYAGIANQLLALAEQNQASQRPMIAVNDENHLFLRVPLLASLQTRMAKMGRKLGLSLWVLTQNVRDFSGEAFNMLSLLENFICLALPPDEIDQIEKFRRLTTEERALFESAKKVPGQYTEGVLLTPRVKGLFRHVPPRPYLAMAATDQSEKYARQQIMKETGCSELDAALQLAERMMVPSDEQSNPALKGINDDRD